MVANLPVEWVSAPDPPLFEGSIRRIAPVLVRNRADHTRLKEGSQVNTCARLALLALATSPLAAVAQEESGLSCIRDVVFSQEFLDRFPKAPAACREVVVKDGQKWIRFTGDVTSIENNEVAIEFLNVVDDPVGTVTLAPAKDAELTINGKSKSYSTLRRGDKLDVWMPESRAGFYAAPGASDVAELRVVGTTAKK